MTVSCSHWPWQWTRIRPSLSLTFSDGLSSACVGQCVSPDPRRAAAEHEHAPDEHVSAARMS